MKLLAYIVTKSISQVDVLRVILPFFSGHSQKLHLKNKCETMLLLLLCHHNCFRGTLPKPSILLIKFKKNVKQLVTFKLLLYLPLFLSLSFFLTLSHTLKLLLCDSLPPSHCLCLSLSLSHMFCLSPSLSLFVCLSLSLPVSLTHI